MRNIIVALPLLFASALTYNRYFDEKTPTYLTASVGEHVVLNCYIDFPQDIAIPYIVNWNKNGETIFSWQNGNSVSVQPFLSRINILDSGINGYGKGSINLTHIRESDGGWFECKIIFPNRTPSTRDNGTWFYLTVNDGNLLTIPPINQTRLIGERAEFQCEVKDSTTTKTSWFKDGVPINELYGLEGRYTKNDAEGVFSIHHVQMEDMGEYECVAVNTNHDRQSARAYLDVQYKALVHYAPREVYFSYGRPAVLDCHFRSNPPLLSLRWEKDGFLFDPFNVAGVFYYRNGSLYFSRVNESHAGTYTCIPYNALGSQGPSPPMKVIVQKAPTFLDVPSPLYTRKVGENLEMSCDARDGDGEHIPIIVWHKKNGQPLPEGRYVLQDGNMTIFNIQKEDAGVYQCSATNDAATISTETELVIESNRRRTPYDFNFTAISTYNSVTIKWPIQNVRPENIYMIWYRRIDTADWKQTQIYPTPMHESEVTIPSLEPGKEYEFMILSQEKHEAGIFTSPLRVYTKRTVTAEADHDNFSPPRNLNVHLAGEGFLVTWDPPYSGENDLEKYVVQWFDEDRSELSGSINSHETFVLVSQLEEDRKYQFQVTAIFYDGNQSPSSMFSLYVPHTKGAHSLPLSLTGAALVMVAVLAAVFFVRKRRAERKSSEAEADQKALDTKS